MKRGISLLVILLGTVYSLSAYDISDTVSIDRKLALNLYIDCKQCDMNYFRNNFTLVNYVQDRNVADVHIFVTSIATGSGGTEYNLILEGKNRFKSMADTVVFSLPGDITYDLKRMVMLEKVQLGLVPYLMKTPYGNRLNLLIDEGYGNLSLGTEDRWKSWMFEVFASGSVLGQKSYKSYGLNTNLYISKVTPDIKFESINDLEFDESRLNHYVEDTLAYSYFDSQQHFFSRNILVKSLGDHAGIGGVAFFARSNYRNLDFQTSIGPAFEYNLFKYADADQKQLRFIYGLLYEHTNYFDTTIYNRMNDYLLRQELNVIFMYVKPWGFVNTTINASSYLNDFSHFSLGASSIVDINLFKGFSLNMSFGVHMYRDQIGLKIASVSPDELLLRQREMQTDYGYDVRVGISYRFGSIYNNTVNPRFGH